MYTLTRTEQSANKKFKKSLNMKRYKFFLENVLSEYNNSNHPDKLIHLYANKFNISRQSLMKYRNKAIQDGILNIHTLGIYTNPKNNNEVYFTTYSIKKHISTFFKVNIDKINSVLDGLKNIQSDWATNHRFDAYERYLREKRNQKIIKNLKQFKSGTENYASVRIDAHLFTKKIAYNPEKIQEVLDFKYPFVKDLQKDVEYINTFLPEDLKNRFLFKIKPTSSGKYVKGISIRITNNSCSNISHEKALSNLTNGKVKRRTKKDTLLKYNLMENPNNDTKSSILRLSESLMNKQWLDESVDCYYDILARYFADVYGLTDIEKDNKIHNARKYFKPLTLSLFFAGSYKMAIKNLYRTIALRGGSFDKCNTLFCNCCPDDLTTDIVEAEDNIKWFLKEIAKNFYLYLGAKPVGDNLIGYSLSNEVFLWESALMIKLMKKLIDLHKDDEIKPIVFQVYDALYTNFEVDNFLELRKEIFEKEILPLYEKYNCYANEEQQKENYKLAKETQC